MAQKVRKVHFQGDNLMGDYAKFIRIFDVPKIISKKCKIAIAVPRESP